MSTGKKTPLRSRARATMEAGVAASMVLGKLSCPAGGPSSAREDSGPVATVTQLAKTLDSEALATLRRDTVLSTAPARRTLFTWTTPEQVEQLKRDRVLLTRTESPTRGPALYDQVVAARAAAGDALAEKLRTPGFVRARHAWANPWATLLGWPDETYGDELIAVHLKPEAWTAKLTTGKPGWEVFDADNGRVDPAEAILHPERIGAVYFVEDGGPAPFREYVLCNESMIECWSLGDKLVSVNLTSSAEMIEELASGLPQRSMRAASIDAWSAGVARDVWPGPEPRASLDETYEAALAFPNERYELTRERMAVLAKRLRAVRLPDFMTHCPQVPPPVVSASVRPLPPPVPRKVPPRPGTWARRRGTH